MNVQRWIAATLVAGGLMAAIPAIAHHSSAPFYDNTKKVEIQGAVTKFVFRNPHAFLYMTPRTPDRRPNGRLSSAPRWVSSAPDGRRKRSSRAR